MLALLRTSVLFEGLSEAGLAEVERASSIRDLPVDTVLFRVRDPGNEMFLVVDGQVEVTLPAAQGTAGTASAGRVMDANLRQIGRGEWFGEVACLEGGSTRTATCIVRRPARLLVVPGDAVLSALRQYPEGALEVAKQLAKRLRAHTERLNRGGRPEPRESPRGGAWDVFSGWWVNFFAGFPCFAIHVALCVLWFAFLGRKLWFFTPSVDLLTNIVSLEAIALCIFILVGQRLQDRREEFRADALYHWADRADEKTSEILRRLTALESRLGFEALDRSSRGSMDRISVTPTLVNPADETTTT